MMKLITMFPVGTADGQMDSLMTMTMLDNDSFLLELQMDTDTGKQACTFAV